MNKPYKNQMYAIDKFRIENTIWTGDTIHLELKKQWFSANRINHQQEEKYS